MHSSKLKNLAKIISITFLFSLFALNNVQAQTVTSNQTGTHGGYNYEYWKDSGNGTMILKDGGSFSCSWDNINNILFRKGIKYNETQTHQELGYITMEYACDYRPNGNSYLAVYGWTSNPLVEYYIIESWGTWKPPGNVGSKGTITVDGGTYDIFETTRYNQPSIKGNTTFQQYWSVRQQKRTSGTISITEHFNAWERLGMRMGKMYEVSLVVEGYQSSGQADVTYMSIKVGNSPNSTSQPYYPQPTNSNNSNNSNNNQTSGQPLRVLAKQLRDKGREFYIGCAVPSYFSAADQEIVKREFDIITCENDMKIGTISPNQNQFNFSGGDRIVQFAKENDMKVHGHTFVWHKYNPWWVDGTKSMMESYINTVATHYKGDIYVWDVVNEAFHRDGSYRINAIGTNGQDGASIYGQKQGTKYIEDAFIAARKADPNAKLIYNDYDLMMRDVKFEAVYQMVKDFKSRNIPIDGVGFQAHLGPDFTEERARAFGQKMQSLAALGVESYVTEMDVGCQDTSQAGLQKQADVFRWITEECIKQPYCRALQVWGIRDSQSWRINPESPEDRAIAPLIFDDNGQKKPAYYAIQQVLEDALNSQILPQIVEGDTNGDGEFNSIDYATLKQILLGINTENRYIYWEQASDLDKNGTVDSIDYALMKMRLLGIK